MTLKAGSYLKLLRDPNLDLLEVIDEEAPPLIRRSRSKTKYRAASIIDYVDGSDEEVESWRDYSSPYYFSDHSIEYENTHGERFSNCSQRARDFTVEPLMFPSAPVAEVWAHNGSPNPEDWSLHRLTDPVIPHLGHVYDKNFGLIDWDAAVYNELYPGYPGTPQHLINDDEGALDIDEALERAYDSIRPAITSDMSLLVTLAELKDFSSLFSEPITFANKLVQLVGRKRAMKESFAKIFTDPDIIPFLAKSLAKGHLYTEFGLKQTVRDVSSLFSTFFSLDRLVRDLLAGTGTNTRHFSLPLYETTESVFEHQFQDYNWIISKRWDSVLSRKFVCTVKYTSELVDAFGQSISPNDPEIVKLGAAMDSLGLNMNPAILWDLVPFSFVVDYFIGVGDWLERFKVSNINPTFSVVDTCYSVKTEISTEGTTQRWSSTWDGMERYPDHPLAAREKYIGGCHFIYRSKLYDRVRFVPTPRMLSGVSSPDFRLPSLSQLKIMGSLLTTNVPIRGRTGRRT